MVRQARSSLLYDGCYAHIISRSIRKLKVFRDEEDFSLFINCLRELKGAHSFKVFHYCLMHTHFHLVVKVNSAHNFSKSLSMLKSRYVFQFHTKYRLSGPIWRERYKSLLIEDDRYLYACGKYVENNPVEAGLVRSAEDWNYSSASTRDKDIVEGLGEQYKDRAIIAEIDVTDVKQYERGNGIGSDIYKFQLRRKLSKES